MVHLALRNSAGFKLCLLFCHSNIVSNTAFQTENLIMKSAVVLLKLCILIENDLKYQAFNVIIM